MAVALAALPPLLLGRIIGAGHAALLADGTPPFALVATFASVCKRWRDVIAFGTAGGAAASAVERAAFHAEWLSTVREYVGTVVPLARARTPHTICRLTNCFHVARRTFPRHGYGLAYGLR